jgi:c-di-GMP-binding flagellar brake protein YcgR
MATQTGIRLVREKPVFRRWERHRLQLPVRLVVTKDKRTHITSGRALDISDGGVLIFAGTELKPAESVLVEFTPPYASEALRARGVVRHRRGYNYGIEFLSSSADEAEHIERFRAMLRLASGNVSA